MSICPNQNLEEWKVLEKAVGKFEAFRDFIETKGEIRTPAKVQTKLARRKNPVVSLVEKDPSMADLATQYQAISGVDINQLKNTRAIELANKMSLALDVKFETITADQAQEITKNATNPWSGEAAFFVRGKVYFIKDRMTSDMVLHEFSHPLVRAISKGNSILFNNLYDVLANTPEGEAIIRNVTDNYNLEPESSIFKEEVIVKALEKNAIQKLAGEKVKPGFAGVIFEILYNFKQLLRKVFGKTISISSLSTDTSLDDLADILTKGDKIFIDTQLVSEEDIIAYNKEAYDEVTSNLTSVRNEDIQRTVNTFYDVITSQMTQLQNNKNYEELADILKDYNLRPDFQEMKSNLSQWQTTIMNATDEFNTDIADSKKRVEALTNTLFRLEDVMSKMHLHLKDIAKHPDTQENMHKAYYYDKFIKHWTEFIEETDQTLRGNGVDASTPIRTMVNGMKSTIQDSKDLINKMYADGARDALYEQLEPLNRNIAERYEGIITKLKERNALSAQIDNVYKEYHGMTKSQFDTFNQLIKLNKKGMLNVTQQTELGKLAALSQKGLSINKDKIEQLLKGQMGDANWFNSYLEGYLYNTDPVVGGLALYTKNALNEVMIVSQAKFNDFASDMRDPLKAAGYNPNKIGQLGKDIGFQDIVARVNPETGELEQVKVWTFLNKFKGHRYTTAVLNKAVSDKETQWRTSEYDEHRKEYIDALADRNQFKRDYMHQEYVDAYYDRDLIFEKDDIGKEALFNRKELFERMRMLIAPHSKSQMSELEIGDEIDELWREYRLMHATHDANGDIKTGGEADVARRLREYRDASREFHEFKERKGVFENAYFNFQQELRNSNIEESSDPTSEWQSRMTQWKKRNSRVTIKPEFYERRGEILDQIKDIMAKLPDADRKEIDQSEVWEAIIDLTSGYKDTDGQTKASEMSPGSIDKVRDLQMTLEEIREKGVTRSGLTKREGQLLSDLFTKQKEGAISDSEKQDLMMLMDKKSMQGLNKWDVATLNSLYTELADMSTKDPTDYYVDIASHWLSKLDLTDNKELDGLNKASAGLLLDPKNVDGLFQQSPEFEAWFTSNHILKEYWNKEKGEQDFRYERLYVWNVTKPTDPTMMEQYKIKDAVGNVVEVIDGLPSMNYYNRVVKTKYRTRTVEGVTKDNQGQYLPKTLEDGAKDATYINEEYDELRNEKPELFTLLEKIKVHHLQNQEGLSYSSKLYLDIPRYRKSNLEVIQTTSIIGETKEKVNALSLFSKRVKGFLKGEEDDPEDGRNHETKFNLVRADMFDNEMTDIPISGLYNIDVDDVSTDVTLGMMRYMMSGERQKQLIKISPIVRAIQNTVNNPEYAIDDLNSVNKKNFMDGVLSYITKKKNVRKAAVNNFIEREFEGQTQTGLGSEQAWLHNFSNLLFKRASFTFFAMNIPSALKNSLGMKFQSMIEASGGKHVDHLSLQKGNGWAYKAMGELSFSGQLITKGPKSHMQQIIDIFDPVQGRFEEKFGETMSRSAIKDIASISWLYSPRKWVEIQAGLQLFGGMMYKKTVTQTMSDGSTKEIPYLKAFETIDGQIRLKVGIDVRYGTSPIQYKVKKGDTFESIAIAHNIPVSEIENAFRGVSIENILEKVEELEELRQDELVEIDLTGAEDEATRTKLMDNIDRINKIYDEKVAEKSLKIDNSEFKFMKNRIHQVQNNMGGAYAKFDQPEAQRYLAFRFITYMRRYFTTMATNRWGFSGKMLDPKPRLNPGLGDVHMGFYIQFGKTIVNTIRNGGANLPYLTQEEKSAALKFGTEVGMLMLTTAFTGLLFGWDPDDDERYDKLRQKSGAMGLLGMTSDDPRRPDFDLLGFLEVHALHTLMQVRAENEQFNLLTGGLNQYNSLLDIKSVAFGPTTDSYVQLWDDFKKIVTGDPKAYYSRQVGPYKWQDQGGSKFITHFAKTFALSGSSLDPSLAIQNFQSYQSKVRK